MMKRIVTFLLLCFAGATAARAQMDQRTLPKQFYVCSDQINCITVKKGDSGWVGLIEEGTKLAWNFQIDDFRMEHLKLTGTSTEKDTEGRNQTVVIQGKPEIIRDGIAHCKARYTTGQKSTSRNVTVTWDVPPPKLTGQVHK